jgi:hypothetical protein
MLALEIVLLYLWLTGKLYHSCNVLLVFSVIGTSDADLAIVIICSCYDMTLFCWLWVFARRLFECTRKSIFCSNKWHAGTAMNIVERTSVIWNRYFLENHWYNAMCQYKLGSSTIVFFWHVINIKDVEFGPIVVSCLTVILILCLHAQHAVMHWYRL